LVLALLPAVVAGLATIALALGAVLARALTPAAGAVAAVFGITIVVLVGFAFLALLILFVVASVTATRYRFAEKERRHVQEGRHGERGVSNVLAHILLPTAIAVLAGVPTPVIPLSTATVLYASALAFGAADTFGSEFGVLAGTARSILTLRPVAPGTNGGVSTRGEGWAAVGALTTALVGLALFIVTATPTVAPARLVAIVAAAGFLGCQADSVLGETLENRGFLTKGSTNFLGMLAAVAIAAGLLAATGGVP
jgi:uncharacterized protein (TIGR00297 family)